jgi:CRISPR/Cas system-associated exonuclease Cas4 (RecB family)
MTDVTVPEALGESLSPSHVSTYMTCPAKLIGLSGLGTSARRMG